MAAPDESSSRMDPYDILEQIGKGAFGAAWIIQTRGTDSAPPRRYVLKKIPLARLSERQRQLSIQERQLVAALRHPYVVPYHRSWIEKSHTICIVMRHCDGGDLASLAWRAKRRNERFPESQLQLWLAQLLSALAYLHGKRVIHRDVKPGNVFLTSDGDVRLGDFGLARVNDASVKDDNQASSAVGTPHFMSPEILKGDKYGFAADVWSLGCVAYELTTLRQPFTAFNMDGLKRKILTSQPAGFNRPGKEGEEDALLYGEGWRSIVRSMLRKAPEDRPSARELLSGQYMSAAAESADARAREIEAAERDEGGEWTGAPTPEPMPGPGGDWSPSADKRGEDDEGRSSVGRGWADLDPSYMRYNPRRKPRPPPRPQSARPASAKQRTDPAPSTHQTLATEARKRLPATPTAASTERPKWNASHRARPASAGPRASSSSDAGDSTAAAGRRAARERVAARKATEATAAVSSSSKKKTASTPGGRAPPSPGTGGFDPYAPVVAKPTSLLTPKQPGKDQSASADENETPSNKNETPSDKHEVVARAQRLLAETSPKLAAPSPTPPDAVETMESTDGRVLRAVAALHARGRHAELAQVLSNYRGDGDSEIEKENIESAAAGLELGQSVIVGRSDPAPGTVRYVGAVAFAEGEWVGIEMETRGVGRHDGVVGGVRYFQCAGGRGVFVASARLTPA